MWSDGVGFWRATKRKVKAAVLPSVFLSLSGFFFWSATQGERGTDAAVARQAQYDNAMAQLDAARADLRAWELRVASLRGDHLDADALDERARAMLNLSNPNDIVLLYPAGKKLF